VVAAYPCHRIEPVIGVDFAHACGYAPFLILKNFKTAGGSVPANPSALMPF
jgi:hypothetical protein